MNTGQQAGGGGALLPNGDGGRAAVGAENGSRQSRNGDGDGAVVATGGAAGRRRGGVAPDRAVVNVCDLCNMRRADLRGACGHKYHARCIYAMPINRCPFCDEEYASDNSGGLLILPIEPFSTSAASQGGEEEDDRASREAEQQSRTGRWHSFETMYAQRIVSDFDAGTLPLCDGTKLGNLLCNILNCSPSRLSKKLKIGKKCFQQCTPRPTGAEHVARHREAQKHPRRKKNELERMFLMAESRASRGMATAEVLSECIQKEWRERLVEHALAVNQRLKNAWDWNSTGWQDRNQRSGAEQSGAAAQPLLQTITPNSSAEATVNHLAPLFLVNHNADNTGGSAAVPSAAGGGGGKGGSSQDTQNALLAQAMAHVLQSWQQGQCVPASDLADPDLQAWQQGQQPPPQEAFRPLGQPQQQLQLQHLQGGHSQGVTASPAMSGHAPQGATGSPSTGSPEGSTVDMKDFADEHLASLEHNLASLAYKNSMVIDMEQKPPASVLSMGQQLQWPLGGASSQGQEKEEAPFMNLGGAAASLMDTTAVPHPGGNASAAAAAAGSGNDNGSCNGGGSGSGGGGAAAAAAVGVAGGAKGGGDEDVAMEDNHPFEDFIANFLDQVPFEAVDVWVPLCDRDQEGSEVVLFHAGYFTNVKELHEWGDYSTNFSFRQGQGIPGRVFGSNQSEFHEDVVNLDLTMFLRLNGARKIGIGTSFALPVVSRWGVTFVIVFYTRDKIKLDKEKKIFIETMVRGWELDATVDTADCNGDGTPGDTASRVPAKPRSHSGSPPGGPVAAP
ncbi:unnamed protein product [Scytosiphon promiscuus]